MIILKALQVLEEGVRDVIHALVRCLCTSLAYKTDYVGGFCLSCQVTFSNLAHYVLAHPLKCAAANTPIAHLIFSIYPQSVVIEPCFYFSYTLPLMVYLNISYGTSLN